MSICKSCKKNEGTDFRFYFGKPDKEYDNIIGATSKNPLIEHVKTFVVEGSSSEPVCAACIRQVKTSRIISAAFRFILIPAVVIGIFFLLKLWSDNSSSSTFQIIIIAIVFFLGFILELQSLSDLIQSLIQKKKEIGEQLASGIGREELKQKDRIFWTETEYLDMKMKELKNRL